MRLYLIRHGETDWNKKRKLQGQVDISLNEFGRLLAEETAPALQEVPFDLVYTSPLKRAKETAEIVIGNRNIPIREEKRIQEMSFGEYEGLCCKEEGWNIPDPEFRYFFSDPVRYHPPAGGESFAQVSERLESFLSEICRDSALQDKTILISTHGAALCGLLRLIKRDPLEKYWGCGVHKNCAVSIVEYQDGSFQVLQENVTYYKEQVKDW